MESVSVVIPAFNAAVTLSETLQSAIAQTQPAIEIIVVDDGSMDGTAEVAASYPGVRVIRQPNAGPGAARNTGIQAASGDWIAFLDSDDIWDRRKTEHQLRCASPEVGLIHGNRFRSISFGSLWNRQAHVSPNGAMVRRQALTDVGGFEESREVMGAEDLNLALRIALTDWKIAQSEQRLFDWRPRGSNLSASDLRMARAELANLNLIGQSINCPHVVVLKTAVRLEYARNLILSKQNREALALLDECEPNVASRFLKAAALSGVRRAARVDILRQLISIRRPVCTGGCTLTSEKRAECQACTRVVPMRPSVAE